MSLIFHWLSGELRIGKVKQMHFIERNTLFYSCIKYKAHFVHLIFCYFVAGIALTRVEKAIITIAIPWSVLRAQKRALLHRNKNGWLRWPVSAPRQGLVTFCQQQQITMEATSKEDPGHGFRQGVNFTVPNRQSSLFILYVFVRNSLFMKPLCFHPKLVFLHNSPSSTTFSFPSPPSHPGAQWFHVISPPRNFPKEFLRRVFFSPNLIIKTICSFLPIFVIALHML